MTTTKGRRYREQWTETARSAWNRASREARLYGAWTDTPPPAAAALLIELARHDDPVAGMRLARMTGVDQGQATSAHLPRLWDMGLVRREEGERTGPSAPAPWTWQITEKGRRMAAVLVDGKVGP